jgi:hypothetical protein
VGVAEGSAVGVGLSVGVKVGVRIDAVGVVGLLKQAVKVRKILINKILVEILITVISVISLSNLIDSRV